MEGEKNESDNEHGKVIRKKKGEGRIKTREGKRKVEEQKDGKGK